MSHWETGKAVNLRRPLSQETCRLCNVRMQSKTCMKSREIGCTYLAFLLRRFRHLLLLQRKRLFYLQCERSKEMKKKLIVLLALVLAFSMVLMTACTKTEKPEENKDAEETTEEAEEEATAETEEATTEEAEEEEEENYETGDASLDDPRNQDEIGEVELLVASFGTSFNDSRRLTIGAIEEDIAAAFPEYSVRRGFTSQIIIDHVKSRDGVAIDNIGEALDRAEANGVKTLVVLPTHLMDGFEYNDLVNEIGDRAEAFEKVAIGKPLLTSDDDFTRVAEALHASTQEYDDGETAIVFMGHGTEAESNAVYAKMQETMTGLGYANYFIGTVEAAPTLEDVMAAVGQGEYKKVVLQPMMVVAGDHANNDMAGDEEDSWKSQFEAAGYEVECVLKGVGEIPEIRAIYVEHAQAAIDSLQ